MTPGEPEHAASVATDRRAVSEVLGVVFMVGVTVIIASIVGVFALGLSQQAAQAEPPVAIGLESVDATSDTVRIEQDGGEARSFGELTIKVQANGSAITFPASAGSATEFEPGDTVTIDTGAGTVSLGGTTQYSSHVGTIDFQTGDTLTVIVIDDDSGTILAERTVLV